MSGVIGAMERRGDSDRVLEKGPAEVKPDVGWLEAASASWRLAQDDTEDYSTLNKLTAYDELEEALVQLGNPRSRYNNPKWGGYFANAKLSRERFNALWADVEAARARNPKAFADLPKTQKEFDTWAYRRKGQRDVDQDLAERGGLGSSIVPALGFGLSRAAEPFNLLQIPMGGVGRTTAGTVLRQFGAGFLGTVATSPETAIARANMGEGYSVEELALDATIGGAVQGGLVAVPALGKAGYEKFVPLDYRMAQALKAAVPANARPPELQAALHVLERDAAIDESSPYVARYEALDAHMGKLQTALAELADMPRPSSLAQRPRPEPVVGSTAARAFDSEGALSFILDLEGGDELVTDSGGLTKYGISANANPGVDIANLTEARAREIYRRKYLAPLDLSQTDGAGALIALDASVNHGPEFARRLLREAGSDPARMIALRRAEYARLVRENPDKYARYAKGWENRLQRLETQAGLRAGERVEVEALAPEPIVRPAALDAVRPIVQMGGRTLPMATFRPDEIGVDADLMQFKSGGDQFGVTERLQGVQSWDPLAAGMVSVWEAKDGRRLIADGHQRLGLAKRLQAAGRGDEIQLNAFVLREADGVSAQDARVLTALKNIGEGTGTAADAAKVFRDVGLDSDAVATRLPPKSALVRDGKALARLSDEAFGAVVNEVIPEGYGAAIGHLAPDPSMHAALVDLLHKTDPANRRQAEAIIRQALDAGFSAETQEELFGSRDVATALFAQKAKVLDRTLGEIKKLKGAFGVAARNAEALDAAGNKIDVGASEAAAQANARALALIDRLALRKGNAVNDLFNDAARRLAQGDKLADVVRDLVRQLGQLDLEQLARGTDAGGSARSIDGAGPGDFGSGRGPIAGDEAGALPEPADELTPATRDELEAAGRGGFALFDEPAHQAFDDTAGPGVQQAADSIWHDLKAEQEAATTAQLEAVAADAHARGATNQATLVASLQDLAGDGIEFKDPGVKSLERIREKVLREGYASADELGDITRAGFVIEDPAAAEAIVARVLEQFPGTVDRGWKQLASGYFDRKLRVRFADGSSGEIQIIPAPVWQAKKAGLNDLYEQLRSSDDPAKVAELEQQSRAGYNQALAGSRFEEIAARSAEGNLAANAAGDSLSPSATDLPVSPGASRQMPPDQAQARSLGPEASTATGRSSTSNNSSFMESPPSGDSAPLSAADPKSQADLARYDLGDGKGERTIAEIEAELKFDEAGLANIRGCL